MPNRRDCQRARQENFLQEKLKILLYTRTH